MLGVVLFTTAMSRADDDSNAEATPAQATAALRKAVGFYRTQVGYQGAYLYKYSADLSKQEGEHDANRTTGWTQPPGTPSVGAAYLDAYLQVGDDYLLAAAREAGEALLRGQLDSGGWSYKFELGERDRLQHAYRLKPAVVDSIRGLRMGHRHIVNVSPGSRDDLPVCANESGMCRCPAGGRMAAQPGRAW